MFKINTDVTEKERQLKEKTSNLVEREAYLKEREVAVQEKELELKQMQEQLLEKQDHDKRLGVVRNDEVRIIVEILLFSTVFNFHFYPIRCNHDTKQRSTVSQNLTLWITISTNVTYI